MTRVLSELLGVNVTQFGLMIKQLERAAGHPNADIRFSTEITQKLRQKIAELGLDPRDTTGAELYTALNNKLRSDDLRVRSLLNMENDNNLSLSTAIHQQVLASRLLPLAFTLKPSVAKRFLKKVPPKKVMKRLGYRSLDSMLRHESVAELHIAARHYESAAWRRKYYEQYAALQPKDFETRQTEITAPKSKRWSNVADEITRARRTHIIASKEFGSVVVLPAPDVPGVTISTLVGVLAAINDIRSTSSYLKLHQVRPDFGDAVRQVVEAEPMTEAKLLTEQVPWKVVHQYYAKFKNMYSEALFEPHIQKSDLQWVNPDEVLASMHPALEFWRDTRYLSYSSNKDSVSLNIADAIVNYCNDIPYASRFISGMRQHVWHELMLRYLDLRNIEEAISRQLQPEFETVSVAEDV